MSQLPVLRVIPHGQSGSPPRSSNNTPDALDKELGGRDDHEMTAMDKELGYDSHHGRTAALDYGDAGNNGRVHGGSSSSNSMDEKKKSGVARTGPHHVEDLERIATLDRVGTNAQYYEKGGLRTEGDGVDHDGSKHKLTPRLFLALTAMAFLWVGSQIPLYLFGGILPDIYGDIGGYDRWVWFVIGYLIPNAALCPFVGALSDLFGRKWVATVGQIMLVIGPIVTCTAKDMNTAIGGQVISGVGAGLNELIALAATGEMVPTAKRGLYVGAIVFTIVPFAPSVVYAQLIVGASNWRYVGAFVAGWNFVGGVMLVIFYREPPRNNTKGYTKREVLRRIDYVGGILSIGGVMCFMMGCQWGAQQYSWGSVHVLVPFIIGCVLIVCFFIWEMRIARYPMVPHRIFARAKRTMVLTLIITFLSGANFFAMLLFWPTEIYNVYGPDRIGVGIRSLPVGFGILGGACIALVLIPITKGQITAIMVFFTALMTAGTGAVSIARPHNLQPTYAAVSLACIGVGGVIIPCTIIAQIICPDDLIATITAITLAVRYVGGAVGFTAYYNVFYKKIYAAVTSEVATKTVVYELGYIQGLANGNITYVQNLVQSYAQAQYVDFERFATQALQDPSIAGRYTYESFTQPIVDAVEEAMALAYRWPYWISIAFGGVSFLCACFLGNIKPFLDEHIAVVL